MLSRGFAVLALAAFAVFALPTAGRSVIETDPTFLYATMKKAYDSGAAKGWPFDSEFYYQATIFDTGRAYSLFRPTDPNYGEVAMLAVDVASQLRYSPLTNNDASLWYVIEASNYVVQNGDPQHQAEAKALLDRLNASEDDPRILAQQAVESAKANVETFRHDGEAVVALVVADVRAYNLTRDAAYRSELLSHMADLATPLARVPDPEFGEMFAIAATALVDAASSEQDRANARAIKARRDRSPELRLIARVNSTPHDLYLTRTAPADEYFGNLKYSPIGVRNEVVRVEKYLDRGWGTRMESDALQVDSSVEDWQKQYPHDMTLPATLLDTYQMLERVDTAKTREAAARLKGTLLVQYPSARQALELGAAHG